MQFIRCTQFPETFQSNTVYFRQGEAGEGDAARSLDVAMVGTDAESVCYIDMTHLIQDEAVSGSKLVYSISKTLSLMAQKVDKSEGYDLSQENYSPAEKSKLEGISEGATANDTDAALRNRASHTGVQAISTVSGLQDALDDKVTAEAGKSLSTNDYSSAEKTKLSGIAASATANATNEQLRDRATHTGAQAISTVDGLETALQNKVSVVAGKGLSTNDYTSAEKTKLGGIAANANNYSHPDGNGCYHLPGHSAETTYGKVLMAHGGVDGAGEWMQLTTAHIDGLVTALNAKANAADVTSALSGKVNTNDTAMTNAREWTAPTATNAQAISASGTERLAWTVTRLRELCLAWWNSTAMKTKLDGVDANANNYTLPNATSTVAGGVKMRLDGTTLYITNDGTNA